VHRWLAGRRDSPEDASKRVLNVKLASQPKKSGRRGSWAGGGAGLARAEAAAQGVIRGWAQQGQRRGGSLQVEACNTGRRTSKTCRV
jgi:hypothetical protein